MTTEKEVAEFLAAKAAAYVKPETDNRLSCGRDVPVFYCQFPEEFAPGQIDRESPFFSGSSDQTERYVRFDVAVARGLLPSGSERDLEALTQRWLHKKPVMGPLYVALGTGGGHKNVAWGAESWLCFRPDPPGAGA